MKESENKGELIMIAAPTKMGKTSFGLTLFSLGVMHFSEKILWVSPKMKKEWIVKMLLTNLSCKVFGNNDDSQVKTDFANEIISSFEIDKMIVEFPHSFNLKSFLTNNVEKPDIKPNYIIIDNFEILKNSDSENINNLINELKKIAIELCIQIIVLYECEFSNNMEEEFDYSNINLDFDTELVDILCFLHRPEYYRIPFYTNGESTLGDASFLVYKHNQLMCEYQMKYDPLNFRFY